MGFRLESIFIGLKDKNTLEDFSSGPAGTVWEGKTTGCYVQFSRLLARSTAEAASGA